MWDVSGDSVKSISCNHSNTISYLVGCPWHVTHGSDGIPSMCLFFVSTCWGHLSCRFFTYSCAAALPSPCCSFIGLRALGLTSAVILRITWSLKTAMLRVGSVRPSVWTNPNLASAAMQHEKTHKNSPVNKTVARAIHSGFVCHVCLPELIQILSRPDVRF